MRPFPSCLLRRCLPVLIALNVGARPIPQEFLQEVALHHTPEAGRPAGAVTALALGPGGEPWARTGEAWFARESGAWQPLAAAPTEPAPPDLPPSGNPFQMARDADGTWWAGTKAGLWRRTAAGWQEEVVLDGAGRRWAVGEVRAVAVDSAGQPWFGVRAGVGVRTRGGWRFFEGKDGLPWNGFTCAAAGPGGEVWFGTDRGAIRWDGREFHYRQGPRWLPDDQIRAIAVGPDGTAWFATGAGVGGIARRPMTLAAKANFYEEEIDRHIRRTPFGFVAEAPLRIPGDRASAGRHDSDNDGLWTAMYGAGECLAYAATGDPRAKARADAVFAALRFLQTVTQGGPVAPPPGFVARTVLPGDGPDPNAGQAERDRAMQGRDALWKRLEPRWPRSADGRWYWKADTSSDELDGHYFFYPLYHDLVARTPGEKAAVREVIRALTDHLLAHGFTLRDHDGRPTRWGMYASEQLNSDPNWVVERGLNSLSLLAYLSAAAHVTGDSRYTAAAGELVARHGYAQNLFFPKFQTGPGSGNQSDDEMAFMCFYTLLRTTRDAALQERALTAWHIYWGLESAERNPFFAFAYAAHAEGRKLRNLWGEFPISPAAGWLEDAAATLRGFPLDRLNWPLRNAHRLDIVPLPDVQSRDPHEPGNAGRGHGRDGRVLPVENRHFNHWNTDPWQLDHGGRGDVLGAGTVFLLPYYLGLHHGYIAKP